MRKKSPKERRTSFLFFFKLCHPLFQFFVVCDHCLVATFQFYENIILSDQRGQTSTNQERRNSLKQASAPTTFFGFRRNTAFGFRRKRTACLTRSRQKIGISISNRPTIPSAIHNINAPQGKKETSMRQSSALSWQRKTSLRMIRSNARPRG
jgi:hypothetical protein